MDTIEECVMNIIENELINELKEEIQTLKTLIVRMTHHEGSLEEHKSQWLPIVQKELNENL